MPYFHLLPYVTNEKYGEGEMSRVVVFFYVFAFNFSLTIFYLEVCSEWSTIASPVDTFPIYAYPHSSFLVVSSEFLLFLVGVS